MPKTAHTAAPTSRKRTVNLTLNESLVAEAKTYTSNLSAIVEELPGTYVAQQQIRLAHQELADACAADWNAVHAAVGSYADEHSTRWTDC